MGQICDVIEVPEVAFTGDTTADWITNPANADVLRARVLIMEVSLHSRVGTRVHSVRCSPPYRSFPC